MFLFQYMGGSAHWRKIVAKLDKKTGIQKNLLNKKLHSGTGPFPELIPLRRNGCR